MQNIYFYNVYRGNFRIEYRGWGEGKHVGFLGSINKMVRF